MKVFNLQIVEDNRGNLTATQATVVKNSGWIPGTRTDKREVLRSLKRKFNASAVVGLN